VEILPYSAASLLFVAQQRSTTPRAQGAQQAEELVHFSDQVISHAALLHVSTFLLFEGLLTLEMHICCVTAHPVCMYRLQYRHCPPQKSSKGELPKCLLPLKLQLNYTWWKRIALLACSPLTFDEIQSAL